MVYNVEADKRYKEKHREEINKKRRERYKKDKEKELLYYKKNKDRIKKVRDKHRIKVETKEKRKIYGKKYRERNNEEIKQKHIKYISKPEVRRRIIDYQIKYVENKKKNDKDFAIKIRLRDSVGRAFREYAKTKKIMKSSKYGIDYNKIINYLGECPGKLEDYEIDHTIPLCSFKFINDDGSTNLEEIKKAFAPENHQWLLIKKNRSKGAKYDRLLSVKNNVNKFQCLNVSSKFQICGLPIRADTYRSCTFNCEYCFSNKREILGKNNCFQIANLNWLKNKLEKIFVKKEIIKDSFLENLIKEKITWHCGGMSDPFQPIEKKLGVTNEMLKITNRYNISILFSTKSDDVYNWENLKPELHTFQLSVTNMEDRKDLEPNVPPIENRIKFYKELKGRGFKVGIRIQPFIPGVTKINIIDTFKDADYISIEGLKLVPQNKSQRGYLIKLLNLKETDFINIGLLNLKPELRLELYKPFIKKLEEYNILYSIADNDLHYLTKSKCCCGEPLIKKSTDFNNTAMFFKNKNYTLEDVKNCLGCYKDCTARNIILSNKPKDCITVQDFFEEKFDNHKSLFSKKFQYRKI
jgi:DNA repair photolyase